MQIAFWLAETAVGKIKEVLKAVKGVEGVKMAYSTTGPYDIIAVVEGEDLNAVGVVIQNKLHTIPGIVRTTICLSVELS